MMEAKEATIGRLVEERSDLKSHLGEDTDLGRRSLNETELGQATIRVADLRSRN